jgi:hypothetical protein
MGYRPGSTVGCAAVGIPRAIRNVLKWPFLMLAIFIGIFVVAPIRVVGRYFANHSQ